MSINSTSKEELKMELERFKEYLAKLENERRKGTISEKAYETLKEEYLMNIKRLESEIESAEKGTSVLTPPPPIITKPVYKRPLGVTLISLLLVSSSLVSLHNFFLNISYLTSFGFSFVFLVICLLPLAYGM
ncbi:MAG: hypothetical protein QXM98_06820 [Thermoproteota archaeon]